MLEIPKNGWSEIKIGDWSDRCSYLDDVPFLLLEALERIFCSSQPSSVKLDAEGWDYTIVFDIFETHVIAEKDDGYSLKTITVTRDEVAQELIEDIRRDINGWSAWMDYGDMTDEQRSARENALLTLCDVVEEYLYPESAEDAPQNCCRRKTGRAYRRYMKRLKKKRLMEIIDYGRSAISTDWGYKNGVYQPIGNHIRYPHNSIQRVYLKKYSNKIVRRSEVQNGGAYKKCFDYWWTLY